MAGKTYVVAKGAVLSSRADGKDYFEGQEIDQSHLTPDEFKNLIDAGKIIEKSTAQKPKE